jgi:hypothetical protein
MGLGSGRDPVLTEPSRHRVNECRRRRAAFAFSTRTRSLCLRRDSLERLRERARAEIWFLGTSSSIALAHHVHRIAPMGARVLIIGNWYKTAQGIWFLGKGPGIGQEARASHVPNAGFDRALSLRHPRG